MAFIPFEIAVIVYKIHYQFSLDLLCKNRCYITVIGINSKDLK